MGVVSRRKSDQWQDVADRTNQVIGRLYRARIMSPYPGDEWAEVAWGVEGCLVDLRDLAKSKVRP